MRKMVGQPRDEVYDRSWLLNARLMRRLRQEDVAKAVGISVGYYNRIEKGIQTPNIYIGLLIADFLEVDVRNYLTEKRVA